jgi:hypothetical protein
MYVVPKGNFYKVPALCLEIKNHILINELPYPASEHAVFRYDSRHKIPYSDINKGKP